MMKLVKIKEAKDADTTYEINLTIDMTDCPQEQLEEWAHASAVIIWQRKARSIWDGVAMEKAEREGLTVNWKTLTEKTQRDPISTLKGRLARGEITKAELLEALGV